MINKLFEILEGKKILILGFGKEGIASYHLLIQYIQPENIYIADRDHDVISRLNFTIHPDCTVFFGENYLEGTRHVDLIIKSPGISQKVLKEYPIKAQMTSQTDLFLKMFSSQIVGVTGTKGKSTTSSLIAEILSCFYKDVLLVGNIGMPPFELAHQITNDTKIVFELSSHQLENVTSSPHISVLLNIYEEHLDHYENIFFYQKAKLNIALFQERDDYLVANNDSGAISKLIAQYNPQGKLYSFSLSELKRMGPSC
ncbi:MAG: Mur ligase family protein [Bacteroidales bacterium]